MVANRPSLGSVRHHRPLFGVVPGRKAAAGADGKSPSRANVATNIADRIGLCSA